MPSFRLSVSRTSLLSYTIGAPPLGFITLAAMNSNVRAIAFVEAILRPSRWQDFPLDYKIAFKLFRTPGVGWLIISVGNLFIKKLLPTGVVRSLSP